MGGPTFIGQWNHGDQCEVGHCNCIDWITDRYGVVVEGGILKIINRGGAGVHWLVVHGGG